MVLKRKGGGLVVFKKRGGELVVLKEMVTGLKRERASGL